MGTGRLERQAPLAGVLFAVLFVVGFLSSGDTPDSTATGEEVVKHYDDVGMVLLGALTLLLGAVLIVFFAGALRRQLAVTGAEWLASVVLGGGVIFAAGLGVFASSQFALVEAADANQPAVAQALNVIDNNNFGTAIIGLTIVLLATAWHVLTTRSLPGWLGWVSLVLGILALAGPLGFVAFLLFPFWVLAVSITLLRRGDPPAATAMA